MSDMLLTRYVADQRYVPMHCRPSGLLLLPRGPLDQVTNNVSHATVHSKTALTGLSRA